jgi:hypothetical protein
MRLLGHSPSPEYRGGPYRILVASLVLCLLLLCGLLLSERTGLIEIDERKIQPEVVSCQIGHKNMEVRVLGCTASYRGEVVPRYEFWLPLFGGCAVYYWDRPMADDASCYPDTARGRSRVVLLRRVLYVQGSLK